MKEKGKIHKKTGPRSTRWAASKYHPTKAELDEDLSIPDATPEKLARSVANYKLNKEGIAPLLGTIVYNSLKKQTCPGP